MSEAEMAEVTTDRRTTYVTVDGTEPSPEAPHKPRKVVQVRGGVITMMSEIEDGLFVAWDTCRGCQKHVTKCTCRSGSVEPAYITEWRKARFEKSVKFRRPSQERRDLLNAAGEVMKARISVFADQLNDRVRRAAEYLTEIDTVNLFSRMEATSGILQEIAGIIAEIEKELTSPSDAQTATEVNTLNNLTSVRESDMEAVHQHSAPMPDQEMAAAVDQGLEQALDAVRKSKES